MSKSKPTVLVVEDDEDIRESVAAALIDEGYTVVCALGSAALRIAAETQPDAILLDVMMPLVDGTRLSQLLRANPRTARIPIVAMTAMPQRTAPEGLRYDAWLGKPFDVLQLLIVLDAVMARPGPLPAI